MVFFGREDVRFEGVERLFNMSERLNLKGELDLKFANKELYYSDCNEIHPIQEKRRYKELVERFEEDFDFLVYHVIETNTTNGKILTFLFVTFDSREWLDHVLYDDNSIFVYTIRESRGWDRGEFEHVIVGENNGCLVRRVQ